MQKQKRTATMPCRDCKAEIAFAVTKKGKNMPVEAESLSDSDIVSLEAGEKIDYRYEEHIPHWKNCPAAESFRKQLKDKQRR